MKKDKKIFARERHYCPYSKNTTCDGWGCGEDCMFHPDFEDDYEPDCDVCHFNKKNRYFEKRKLRFQRQKARNYVSGLSPCVDCDCDKCPVPDGDDNSFESMEEAYDCGFSQGLDCGYIEGYKDGFMEEQPQIENDDIREMIEETEEIRNPYKDANEFYVMGYKDCFWGEPPKIKDDELGRYLENKSGV